MPICSARFVLGFRIGRFRGFDLSDPHDRSLPDCRRYPCALRHPADALAMPASVVGGAGTPSFQAPIGQLIRRTSGRADLLDSCARLRSPIENLHRLVGLRHLLEHAVLSGSLSNASCNVRARLSCRRVHAILCLLAATDQQATERAVGHRCGWRNRRLRRRWRSVLKQRGAAGRAIVAATACAETRSARDPADIIGGCKEDFGYGQNHNQAESDVKAWIDLNSA